MNADDQSAVRSTGVGGRDYVRKHYSKATMFGDQAPPEDWLCANCGDTSARTGRFRDADAHEESDEEGETYECSTCGCKMALPPPNDPSSQTREETDGR